MMALENKETMQNCEAALKCLQTKGFPYNLQCFGNSIEGLSELKYEIGTHPGGDVVEPICSLNGEFMELPNEFYHKPTIQHEYGSWSTFYPDSHKLQPYPFNAFGSQFYHLPVDNQFHYAPFNVITHGHPSEFQFQDFQYFVVIDFEATCDKERNPHPQEIIEFPSVIVSSVTGQLEACFQSYVRPTCNSPTRGLLPNNQAKDGDMHVKEEHFSMFFVVMAKITAEPIKFILDTAMHTGICPSVKGERPEAREGHSAALVETFVWKRAATSGNHQFGKILTAQLYLKSW